MRTVVASRFLPGLGTVIPPLAGAFGIPLSRFLAYDALGSLLYGACFLGLGYLFNEQLERVGSALAQLGGWAIVLLAGLVGVYIAYKFIERQRVLRRLRIARVTPEEVFQKQQAGEQLVILDLRSAAELKLDATRIRGAIYMNVAEVEHRHGEIPRDRDVIVYCSCPNEVTAARIALLLQRKGITRVRPLLGGIRAWRELQYPVDVETLAVESVAQS
jgi:rhodanese-related sulfurtransferase